MSALEPVLQNHKQLETLNAQRKELVQKMREAKDAALGPLRGATNAMTPDVGLSGYLFCVDKKKVKNAISKKVLIACLETHLKMSEEEIAAFLEEVDRVRGVRESEDIRVRREAD